MKQTTLKDMGSGFSYYGKTTTGKHLLFVVSNDLYLYGCKYSGRFETFTYPKILILSCS
jgi:hypothetical protein